MMRIGPFGRKMGAGRGVLHAAVLLRRHLSVTQPIADTADSGAPFHIVWEGTPSASVYSHGWHALCATSLDLRLPSRAGVGGHQMPHVDIAYEELPDTVKDNLTEAQWREAERGAILEGMKIPETTFYVNLKNG